jgi:hypothetical protein
MIPQPDQALGVSPQHTSRGAREMWLRSVIGLAFSALPLCATPAEERPGGVDGSSLVEVRRLSELPSGAATALGWQKAGLEGMADAGGQFNSTNIVDSRLPLRRFISGGANANSALIGYEEGGPSYPAHTYHARAYLLDKSGWKQTGEWTLGYRPHTLQLLLSLVYQRVMLDKGLLLGARVHGATPVRRDGPLREADLSDEEAREIQGVAHVVVPDALVNISGVVTGCPCEDGTGCSDQVWIVAYRPGEMKGLQLSRIDRHWVIGPVQQWWLESDKLYARRASFTSWTEFMVELRKLDDRFPTCTGQSAASTTEPAPQRQH